MKITDATVKTLSAPSSGNKVYYDGDPAGFGVRVTAAGIRSFVFTYRVRGSQRQRQITIGRCSNWTARVARDKARALRRQVDDGGDPLGDLDNERQAPTVSELADRFVVEHVAPKTRPGTATAYLGHLRRYIRPALGNLKVAAVKFGDIDRLHRHVTDSRGPYAANRTVATLTKMFGLAVRWGYRTDNPCKGVAANRETKRRRYLKDDELPRLLKAMAAHSNRGAVNIVRMLLLTGGRVGEVLAMRWEDVDLGAGTWHKRAAATKQKTDHSVPLSAPARALLSEIAAEQAKGGAKQVFVFSGTEQRVRALRRPELLLEGPERRCRHSGRAATRLAAQRRLCARQFRHFPPHHRRAARARDAGNDKPVRAHLHGRPTGGHRARRGCCRSRRTQRSRQERRSPCAAAQGRTTWPIKSFVRVSFAHSLSRGLPEGEWVIFTAFSDDPSVSDQINNLLALDEINDWREYNNLPPLAGKDLEDCEQAVGLAAKVGKIHQGNRAVRHSPQKV